MTLICAPERIRAVLNPVHPIDEEAVARLHAYTRILDRWAARQRLVGWRRAEVLLHDGIRDAWSAIPLLEGDRAIVDVGSGAGLPGLIFAAALPERAIHLVEARRKRVSFLREAAKVMGVSGVVVHHGRTDDLIASGEVAPADALVTSRAFAAPSEVLQMATEWDAAECLITSADEKIPSDDPVGWNSHRRMESRPHSGSFHVLYQRAAAGS